MGTPLCLFQFLGHGAEAVCDPPQDELPTPDPLLPSVRGQTPLTCPSLLSPLCKSHQGRADTSWALPCVVFLPHGGSSGHQVAERPSGAVRLPRRKVRPAWFALVPLLYSWVVLGPGAGAAPGSAAGEGCEAGVGAVGCRRFL